MAGERENLTENSEKPDNNISGLLRLNTEEGPIVLDIRSAFVVSGNEKLAKKLVESPDHDGVKVYMRARGKLDDYIESKKLAAPHGEFLQYWKRRWDTDRQLHGEDALVTLFPRDTDREISYVEKTLKLLESQRGKRYLSNFAPDSINTKSQLVDTPDGILLEIFSFGPKTLELTSLMKGVILAERRLEEGEV